jgi:hypothetical protein
MEAYEEFLLGYATSHLTRVTVALRALESMGEKWATMLSPKKKDSKLIARLPPSPLQHDQHYVNIMFTLSAAHTLLQIATYISAKLNASYSRNPISILVYGFGVDQIPPILSWLPWSFVGIIDT